MKKSVLIVALFFFINNIFSQDCDVLLESIKGKYTGDCDNKKAEGMGKSEGTDTYEGIFKSGYPSGPGTYTYKNGNFYSGVFKKGLKEGRGEFHYKRAEADDSIVKGVWQKDVYMGLYLHPYDIEKKSSGFTRLEVKPEVAIANSLTIVSSNVIKSNSLLGNVPPGLPEIKYFNVDEGSYEREERHSTDKITTLVLYGLKFPFHIRVNYEVESFELLISKEGTWRILSQISLSSDN